MGAGGAFVFVLVAGDDEGASTDVLTVAAGTMRVWLSSVKKDIRTLARQIIAQSAGGIRYSQLKDQIEKMHPETPSNTVQGSIWILASLFPNEIVNPSRGLFKPAIDNGMPAGSPWRTEDRGY